MKNDEKEIIEYRTLSGISITYENAPTTFPGQSFISALRVRTPPTRSATPGYALKTSAKEK